MKKNQGFTLVELVIVIVILGILAVTAAPKFLNLAGDAKISTLNGLKGSIESANALVYSKAILQSKEKGDAAAALKLDKPEVNLVYGYPKATKADLEKVLELSADEWVVVDSTSTTTPVPAAGKVVITPIKLTYTTTTSAACQLIYSQSTGPAAKPVLELQTDGC
jgi:MSHA pilin protein MshA